MWTEKGSLATQSKRVAGPINGVYQVAMRPRGFELAPQLFDMAINGAIIHDALIAIDAIHELITRKNPAGIFHQQPE